MNVIERDILLLCCHLGDSNARPLTAAQYFALESRTYNKLSHTASLALLDKNDFLCFGYSEEEAARMFDLLNRQSLLEDYLGRGQQYNCYPLTGVSSDYPQRIISKQSSRTPVLFARGDLSLLEAPSVAVVGSRELLPPNELFARTAGQIAAKERLALVSGGARGADRTAQNACLQNGGSCVIFVADQLLRHEAAPGMLYLSEDGFDFGFSTVRALSRNRLIHMQADKAIACQSDLGFGGTWQGCVENLNHGWSSLFVFDDGSPAMKELIVRGATGIQELQSIKALEADQMSLFG